MAKFITIILALLLIGCERDTDFKAPDEFEVVIAGKGMDCRLTLIDFKEKDLDKVEKITGTNNWTRYHAYNLSESFNKVGQVIIITIRKTKDDELSPCTFMGPTYPWVTVLNSKLKE